MTIAAPPRPARPAAPSGTLRATTVAPGNRFGRLVVTAEEEPYLWRGRFSRRRWACDCACGGSAVVREDSLLSGHTTSCGCRRDDVVRDRATRHGARSGDRRRPEYQAWQTMRLRGAAPVCARWQAPAGRGFQNFLADLGRRPSPAHRLVRLDPSRPFAPSNCRWAKNPPRAGVPRRLITVRGRRMTLREAAAEAGIAYATLCKRLERGWSTRAALTP
ncbi:hypothetical protein [Falsiroseomonas ponticola]|uniref:hypothetical protein n=1 Tax=Falsiroseomonas ponticola TaxID=2786951 RepID=UPI0019327A4D|nr:hypothetical protein [Roseomonas ponticola]